MKPVSDRPCKDAGRTHYIQALMNEVDTKRAKAKMLDEDEELEAKRRENVAISV